MVNRFRYERLAETYMALSHMAAAIIVFRKTGGYLRIGSHYPSVLPPEIQYCLKEPQGGTRPEVLPETILR